MKILDLDGVKKILENHEKRILALEKKKTIKVEDKENWYRKGSTIEKIISLINEGFFNKPHSIKEIILELKTKDYHLKAGDITLPLRKIVRKGLLEKTKKYSDGAMSKK